MRKFQTFVGGVSWQALAQSGWTIGRNVRIDTRWAHGRSRRNPQNTLAELVAARARTSFSPTAPSTVGPLCCKRPAPLTGRVSRPFVRSDRPPASFDSLARPGGNATGFMTLEYSLGGKWLELLKEIAPSVTRAAVLRDPAKPRRAPPSSGIIQAVGAVAPGGESTRSNMPRP